MAEEDDLGRELEVTAVDWPDYVWVVNVMPTSLRRK
jgi:hypothetical protein